MTPPSTIRSPYGPLHAVLAGAVLVCALLSNGPAAFWRQFVHGHDFVMTTKVALCSFAVTSAFFAAILLFTWISTLFSKRRMGEEDAAAEADVPRPNRLRAVKLACVCALPVFLVAFGLHWLCAHLLEWAAGSAMADQDLVKCLLAGGEPLGLRIALCLSVLFAAPLVEEPLFRGVVFRGLASAVPAWAAAAASGFLFALVHVNAASFLPLWYLGAAFAWLYLRTGTILAPMTLHALFNGVNLALLFICPDIAA